MDKFLQGQWAIERKALEPDDGGWEWIDIDEMRVINDENPSIYIH